MAKNTPLAKDEILPRIDYFEDWIKRLSANMQSEQDKVVDDKTAEHYLQLILHKDSSLSNLSRGLADQNDGFRPFIETDFIQDLIKKNTVLQRLDKSLEQLGKKRRVLERALPKKKAVTRRKVISAVMTKRVLKQYGINKTVDKNGVTRYRNLKGQFTKGDTLLKIADKVLIASKSKRLEVERLLKKDARGKPKK